MKEIILIDFDKKRILIRDEEENSLKEVTFDLEASFIKGERRPCIRTDHLNHEYDLSSMTAQEAKNWEQYIIKQQREKAGK